MAFKDNFVRLCNERGVSPSKVVEAIGLKRSAYSQWTEESIPRKATLMRIADYFDVSVDYLLGNDEIKKPAGITDELWNALCKDDVKMDLAIQISKMSPEKAQRVLVLLQAAQMLPPEENNPADTE